MAERIYKYNSERRTLILSTVYIVILSLASVLFFMMYVGGYFSAWFISVVVALVALLALSIPRRIIVDEQAITIVCLVEIAEIPIAEIVSARPLPRSERRWMMPLFGSYGFFGYYGYYLNFSTFERVRFYATEWQHLIEIVDIYDDKYYISCREAEELLTQINIQIVEHFEEV